MSSVNATVWYESRGLLSKPHFSAAFGSPTQEDIYHREKVPHLSADPNGPQQLALSRGFMLRCHYLWNIASFLMGFLLFSSQVGQTDRGIVPFLFSLTNRTNERKNCVSFHPKMSPITPSLEPKLTRVTGGFKADKWEWTRTFSLWISTRDTTMYRLLLSDGVSAMFCFLMPVSASDRSFNVE